MTPQRPVIAMTMYSGTCVPAAAPPADRMSMKYSL
jgi:hypothetical protein